MKKKKHVVIIGGGFGGITTAKLLSQKGYQITIVNPREEFIFTPFLAAVAGGELERTDVSCLISEIVKGPGVVYLEGLAEAPDFQNKTVQVNDTQLTYDYVVLATGAQTNFYGLPGSEHAYQCKTLDDASSLRQRVSELVSASDAPVAPVVVNVVGGGPTGVEFAFSLHELIAIEAKKVDKVAGKVRLIQGMDVLVPVFNDKIQRAALKQAEKRGIEVVLGAQANAITETGIQVGDVHYDANISIWSAGVKPATECFNESCKNDRGSVIVDATLQIKGRNSEFALGDIIVIGETRVPALAQTAMQQAKIVAANIDSLENDKQLEEYKVSVLGQLVSFGSHSGAGTIGPVTFTGIVGLLIWSAAYTTKIPCGIGRKLTIFRKLIDNTFTR